MPTALLEAMASGLPSVATSVGGACEVVVDGENGLLVPPRAPAALARALLLLLANAPLRQRLGRRATETVESTFSWDAVCERYLACYRRVLAERG
jgi:glycosyltransferase involved in cell wall biosynthesis